MNSRSCVVQCDNCSGSQLGLSRANYLADVANQNVDIDVGHTRIDERRQHRACRRENGRKVLVVADDDRATATGLRDDLSIFSATIHDIGHTHNVETIAARPFNNMARDVNVREKVHAADGSETVWPDANQAAYLRHSEMSSNSNSGNSLTTCAGVFPPAKCVKTSDTGIRTPRVQGWPLQTRGSAVMRVRGPSIAPHPTPSVGSRRTRRARHAFARPWANLFGSVDDRGTTPNSRPEVDRRTLTTNPTLFSRSHREPPNNAMKPTAGVGRLRLSPPSAAYRGDVRWIVPDLFG
jgi:hypothetical protein